MSDRGKPGDAAAAIPDDTAAGAGGTGGGDPGEGPARIAATGGFDPDRPQFTVAVLPDTQYLLDADSAEPAPLRATLAHLLQRRAADNVAFLAGLGDITEHGTAAEFAIASDLFRAIDGKLPYSAPAGNHDLTDAARDDQRGSSPYLTHFGPARFRDTPTFLGATPDGYNTAHLFTAAGRPWLNLALDWRTSPAGLAWARDVLARHATVPTILTTHDLAYSDGGAALLTANGRRLWDELISANDQIFLTINGHDWPSGRAILPNAAGHDVHVHITNYQDRYYGGAGMIRLYRFDLARNVIDVEAYSPWLLARKPAERTPLEAETARLTSDVDRFSLAINFGQRFAGFTRQPPPPVRPAAAVIERATAAYWRFDTAGQVVTEGAVVPDRSGSGNDLTVRRLPGTAESAAALTADHHVGAPAQASIFLDGGRSPARGAMLQTAPGAPLNRMTFLDGYTVELFVKLPEPYIGDHGFMGLFSFENRSGDAGKRSSWTTREPTFSLNLSGERFLQHICYTADGDHYRTSWSHALPTGVWTHLAIVNDGNRSIIWVDGSRIVRNPAGPTRGIATTGGVFTLGATSFDLQYDQGFAGWFGDVRITARALDPPDFLPGGRYR